MRSASVPSPCKNRGQIEYAGMMELVDMRDLGSRAAMRWGSSPHARTKNQVSWKENCFSSSKRLLCYLTQY